MIDRVLGVIERVAESEYVGMVGIILLVVLIVGAIWLAGMYYEWHGICYENDYSETRTSDGINYCVKLVNGNSIIMPVDDVGR